MLCVSAVCIAQNVTIRAVNQPASVVFRSIVEQTGKNFVYSSELLKNMRVSVNVRNKSLKQTLSIIFKDSDIEYEIKGKNIILKRKPKPKKREKRPVVSTEHPIIPKHNEGVPKMLEEVVVVSRLEAPAVETAEIGAKKLTAQEIINTPVLFGESDVIKALQMQPGVSEGQEGMAGMHVHGGNADENLYMLDNVPLYQVNHFAGLFSAFNAKAIRYIDFFKSSIPAKYDGRLSSYVVFSPGELYDNKHLNSREITDVDNGIFSVERGNKVVYYDVTGKELLSVEAGSAFYDGYAFVTTYPGYETLNNGTMVINSAMQPVRILDSDICPAYKVMEGSIVFKPYGLVSLKAQGYVLNPQGNVVLETYDNHKGNYIRGIGQFSPSGYSKCTDVRLNDESYNAFLKPSGEITWMFSDTGGGGQFSDPVGPQPTDSIPDFGPGEPSDSIPKIGPNPPYPIPPIKLITVDINQKPVGPTTVTAQKFKVSVVAEPAEGGSASISPAGAFSYGETATVSAAPAKDWAVSSISSSIGGNLSVGKPFTVTTDQTITVRFAKKDDDKNPEHTGAYQGTIRIHPYDIPVYMQVNAEGKEATPYGDNTCGYLQIMFDPETRYTNEKQELAVSLFAVPLQITGVQHDEATGRRWLVLDGGSVAFHDLKVNPATINPLMVLYINTLLRVNNFSDVTTRPMHYRVEMLDLDPETGEFTFGDLQAYSAENGGWFAGGDKAVSKITKGVMATMTDRGYPAETFAGARMKKSAPRTDVMWYPPKSWSKTESLFEMIVKSMTESYRTARSDYNRIFGE